MTRKTYIGRNQTDTATGARRRRAQAAPPIRIKCADADHLKIALAHLEATAKSRGALPEELTIVIATDYSATIHGVPAPVPYADLDADARAAIDASPIYRTGRRTDVTETTDARPTTKGSLTR